MATPGSPRWASSHSVDTSQRLVDDCGGGSGDICLFLSTKLLILRRPRSGRLEGWIQARRLRPSFETRATQVGCSRLAHHNADLGKTRDRWRVPQDEGLFNSPFAIRE